MNSTSIIDIGIFYRTVPYRAMQKSNHNYAAAFLQFLDGRPLDEIAERDDIPITTLKAVASHNGWPMLKMTFEEKHPLLPRVDIIVKEQAVIANRERNMAQATLLRDKVEEVLKTYADSGTPLTAKTLRDLACAAATIQDLTYRAVGDSGAKRDPNQPDVAPRTQITVNIPAIIASPRDVSRVLEVRADAPEIDQKPPVEKSQ